MTWTPRRLPEGVTHPQRFRGSEKTLHLVMRSWSSVYEGIEAERWRFIREIERPLELGVGKTV